MNPGVRAWLDRAWRGLLLGTMTLFVVNVALMIAAVATSSFARRWLGTWFPEGSTDHTVQLISKANPSSLALANLAVCVASTRSGRPSAAESATIRATPVP